MTTEPARRFTPIRSLAEIAILAGYLIIAPQLLERFLSQFGLSAEGTTQVLGTSGLYVGFFLLAVVLTKLRGQTLAELGLGAPKRLGLTIACGLGLAGAAFAIVEALMYFGAMQRDFSHVASLRNDLAALFAWITMVVVLTGVIEEFIYRAFMMDRIASALGDGRLAWGAAFIGQAVIFGLAHAYGDLQLILFAGGFSLAYAALYFATGRNLWAPIIAHSVYDASRIVLAYVLLTNGATAG